jgi:retron-type reverse transcriptase
MKPIADIYIYDMFAIENGLKQGDAISPLLLNFVLGYVINRIQINLDGFKLNGTHQFLVYADDVNILGVGVLAMKKNSKSFSSRW